MFGSKLFASVLFLGAALQAVTAATTVTAPEAGAVWQAKAQETISWTGATESTVDVRLVQGPATNLQFVAFLCQNVKGSDGKCTATVPAVKSNYNYAVTVGKDPSIYGYSSYFDINGDGPMPPRTGCPKMGGQNCPQSLPCCSASGFCGNTAQHCGSGCMAKYSFNGECAQPGSGSGSGSGGSGSGSGTCGSVTCTSSSPCCSQYNYCGATGDHCGKGCQAGKSFGGKCVVPSSTSKPKTTPASKKCGKQLCNKSKPCCNKLTNTCTNDAAGCLHCNAKKSYKGKCKK